MLEKSDTAAHYTLFTDFVLPTMTNHTDVKAIIGTAVPGIFAILSLAVIIVVFFFCIRTRTVKYHGGYTVTWRNDKIDTMGDGEATDEPDQQPLQDEDANAGPSNSS